jgi:tetratricopeptide (TPR) repeat protein
MALLRRRSAGDYRREALLRSRAGDHAAALAAADQAIKIAPGSAEAYHLRGCALSGLARREAALDAFRQAVTLDPALTYVHYRIALELDLLGRYGEALGALNAFTSTDPDDVAPLVLRGAILFDLERYEDALDAFTVALQRQPGAGQVHLNRARVLRRLGRYREALAGYDQAFRLSPELERRGAGVLKAVTLTLAGRYDEALTAFTAAAAAAHPPPGTAPDGTADVWCAAIAWHRQDPAEAHRRFGLAAGKPVGTEPCETVNMRAVVACALGQPGSAAELLGAGYELYAGAADVVSGLYDLLSDPPMAGIGELRAAALTTGPGT